MVVFLEFYKFHWPIILARVEVAGSKVTANTQSTIVSLTNYWQGPPLTTLEVAWLWDVVCPSSIVAIGPDLHMVPGKMTSKSRNPSSWEAPMRASLTIIGRLSSTSTGRTETKLMCF